MVRVRFLASAGSGGLLTNPPSRLRLRLPRLVGPWYCGTMVTGSRIPQLKTTLAVFACRIGNVRDQISKISAIPTLYARSSVIPEIMMWSIYDTATLEVKKNYYSEYKCSRDAPSALCHAMLAVIRSNSACWGAFCIIGVTPGIIQHHYTIIQRRI